MRVKGRTGTYEIDHDALTFVEVHFGSAVVDCLGGGDVAVETDRGTDPGALHEAAYCKYVAE